MGYNDYKLAVPLKNKEKFDPKNIKHVIWVKHEFLKFLHLTQINYLLELEKNMEFCFKQNDYKFALTMLIETQELLKMPNEHKHLIKTILIRGISTGSIEVDLSSFDHPVSEMSLQQIQDLVIVSGWTKLKTDLLFSTNPFEPPMRAAFHNATCKFQITENQFSNIFGFSNLPRALNGIRDDFINQHGFFKNMYLRGYNEYGERLRKVYSMVAPNFDITGPPQKLRMPKVFEKFQMKYEESLKKESKDKTDNKQSFLSPQKINNEYSLKNDFSSHMVKNIRKA